MELRNWESDWILQPQIRNNPRKYVFHWLEQNLLILSLRSTYILVKVSVGMILKPLIYKFILSFLYLGLFLFYRWLITVPSVCVHLPDSNTHWQFYQVQSSLNTDHYWPHNIWGWIILSTAKTLVRCWYKCILHRKRMKQKWETNFNT